MSERVLKIIENQNAGRAFVSTHAKGRGAVGFGDMDTPPIISETFEVRGKAYKVETEEGTKIVVPKARLVVLGNGELDIIAGGVGTAVSEEDAHRLLNRSDKVKLTKALKPRNSVK